ncbi:MAG: hypothetical protein ACD_33C00046G0012 [uncultured bacterium]|nr:MAG: hypothetical protein ACD_33C00046G0012 [uncultured bacterium]
MLNKIKMAIRFITGVPKKIGEWISCKIGHHQYTCAANEGIQPTKEQLEGGIKGFDDYAKMYCARPGCKYIYKKRKQV